MRHPAPLLLLLLAVAAPAHAGHADRDDSNIHRPLFVAPDCKPYRGRPGDPYPVAAWFAEADANHDGRLDRAEFTANFLAYFDVLDADHDGEIGPQEIGHFESDILPEVRMASPEGSFGADEQSGGSDDDSSPKTPPERPRGASFFGFFGAPEPLIVMDANFDRGISRAEYAAAAAKSFRQLDATNLGYLTLATLPKTAAQR